MSATVYGPDETWPTHQKQHWRVALKQARGAGWTLKHLGASHRFGVVMCPAGEHTFEVDMTARGAETKAKQVPKLLRACQHGATAQAEPRAGARRAECERLLTRAEELIDAAAADLARAEQYHEVLAHLERIRLLIDSADANINGMQSLQDEALEQAVALEDAPGPDAVAQALGEAEDATDCAAATARKIRRAATDPLMVRVATAHDGIAGLRERLSAIQR